MVHDPLFGAKFAIIGSDDSIMPKILALTITMSAAAECKKLSGWEHNPTVGIYELVRVDYPK